MVVSPACRVPSPCVSTSARMVHPASGFSSSPLPAMLSTPSASRVLSAFLSWNLIPETVPPFRVGLIPRFESLLSVPQPCGPGVHVMILVYSFPDPPEYCDAPLPEPHSLSRARWAPYASTTVALVGVKVKLITFLTSWPAVSVVYPPLKLGPAPTLDRK